MNTDAYRLTHAKLINSVVAGHIPPPVDSTVRRSWARCLHEYGLDPARPKLPIVMERSALEERRERLSSLLFVAKDEMANLYQQVAGSGYALVLTDADGVVLHCTGDEHFVRAAAGSGLRVGGIWSEDMQGTNGMGTCIVERKPLVIHREDHFYANHIHLTCSAAPIFDPGGNLLAVLDASGHSELAQQHTVVLVTMSAQLIENRFFLHAFRNHFVMRFHSRPEFVNTLGEGLLALNGNGKILAANRSAQFQLGRDSSQALCGRRLEEIFDTSLAELCDGTARSALRTVPVRESMEGRRFFALVQNVDRPRTRSAAVAAGERPRREHAVSLIDQLEFGDPVMAENVRRAKRVVDRNIPMLILGETGTGKGMFAKALHLAGARAEKPFVAVNCASLPETLIESELFGYRPGAFTGASREGRRGKILQANGGTLFLDEIGDMPLPLQARLLRVLEEKEVVPLGSDEPVPVDVNVVSATHADLEQLVAMNRFREDLYYRLQGVTFRLPPLRQRADRRNLIVHLLELESGPDRIEIDDQAMALLDRCEWPGNIRQLRNTLKTMIALRTGDRLGPADIPPELLHPAPAGAPPAADADESAPLSPLELAEREVLLRLLEQQRWNITRTAKRSGVSRNTLYRKMKRLGIDPARTDQHPSRKHGFGCDEKHD